MSGVQTVAGQVEWFPLFEFSQLLLSFCGQIVLRVDLEQRFQLTNRLGNAILSLVNERHTESGLYVGRIEVQNPKKRNRRLLHLRYRRQLTVSEAAGRLDLSPRQVAGRLVRLRHRLLHEVRRRSNNQTPR